ncbi:MAG: DMT family transporter [Elstera sp.]|jgi:drug/metabolite transporter (DMT)-like permease
MSTPQAPLMTASDWAILVLLSFLWGGSFLFAKIAVAEVPPFTIVLIRVAGGALVLAVAVKFLGLGMPRERAVWARFLTLSMLSNVIPFSLIVYGQTQIGAGLASILNATTPLFTLIVTHLVTQDEKLTPMRLAGVMAGFAGVTIMLGPSAASGLSGPLLAQLAVLLAAFSYGWAGWYGRRLTGLHPLQAALGQVTTSSLVMLPLALLVEHPWALPMPSTAAVASLAGLAIFSTALAYGLYFRVLARVGAGNASLVTFLIPPSALLMGIVFLDEHLTLWQGAGMVGIGAGLALVDGRLIRKFL